MFSFLIMKGQVPLTMSKQREQLLRELHDAFKPKYAIFLKGEKLAQCFHFKRTQHVSFS